MLMLRAAERTLFVSSKSPWRDLPLREAVSPFMLLRGLISVLAARRALAVLPKLDSSKGRGLPLPIEIYMESRILLLSMNTQDWRSKTSTSLLLIPRSRTTVCFSLRVKWPIAFAVWAKTAATVDSGNCVSVHIFPKASSYFSAAASILLGIDLLIAVSRASTWDGINSVTMLVLTTVPNEWISATKSLS
jgi:hypothetical protein